MAPRPAGQSRGGSPPADTVYLGQFTQPNADRIAGELENAGIEWWFKQSGRFAQFIFAGDWGVRLFVEESRRDEARTIAEDLAGPLPNPPR